MSRFPDALVGALLLTDSLAAAPALAGDPDVSSLGRAPTEAEIAAWDIDVRPDGAGLPEGGMSVADGESVYIEKCAACHGDFAEGVGRWPVLAGGQGTLAKARPVKTVGSYWPYLSTLWDYVHRAMPFGANLSLSDDEVYGVSAYILYMNDIVDDPDFVLSRESFGEVAMPNQDGFFDDPRPETAIYDTEAPCMQDCRDPVEITMRATVLDVTPDGDPDANAGAEDQAAALEDSAAEAAAEPEPAAAPSPDPALAEAGEKVFRKCKACHMVGEGAENRVGPHLNGVLGRQAAALDGFRYSPPLAEQGAGGLVWTNETLSAFLADPKGYVKGTRMAFRGIGDEADRAALIAYLATLDD